MRIPRSLARLAARSKPRIPDSLWPTLLALRSVPGDGPLVGLPAFDRALVLSAHPDDESVGCIGTAALLARAGATVELLAATDGEATRGSVVGPDETAALRRGELRKVGDLIGAPVEFLGLPDGSLPSQLDRLCEGLAKAVERLAPQVIFAPWLADGHPDHQAVALAVARIDLADEVEIWGYETWAAVPANRVVDVTAVIETKEAALAAHVTAAKALDMSAGLGLSRWRSLHGMMGRGWAEAFLALSGPDYVRTCELVQSATQAEASR